MTSLYRTVEVSFWSLPLDADQQRVAMWLMTGPATTQLPGIVADAGPGRIADALGLEYELARAALHHLVDIGWLRYDPKTRLAWRPGGILSTPPSNPKVVVGWVLPWSALPRCALLEEIVEAFSRVIEPRSEDFAKAWQRVITGDAEPARDRGIYRFGNGTGEGTANGSGKGTGDPSAKGTRKPIGDGSGDRIGDGVGDGTGKGTPNGTPNGTAYEEELGGRESRDEEEDPEREGERAPARGESEAEREGEDLGEGEPEPPEAAAPRPVSPEHVDAAIEAYRAHCKPLVSPPPPGQCDAQLRELVAQAIAREPVRSDARWWAAVTREVAATSYARGARWQLRDVLREPGRLEEYADRARARQEERKAALAPAAAPAPAAPVDPVAAQRAALEAELARFEGRVATGRKLTTPEQERVTALRQQLEAMKPQVRVVDRGETRVEYDGDAPLAGEKRAAGKLAAKVGSVKYSARARASKNCPFTVPMWPMEEVS